MEAGANGAAQRAMDRETQAEEEMTVAELRAAMAQFPDDMPVCYTNLDREDGGELIEISQIDRAHASGSSGRGFEPALGGPSDLVVAVVA
jgi:hypothetical protein